MNQEPGVSKETPKNGKNGHQKTTGAPQDETVQGKANVNQATMAQTGITVVKQTGNRAAALCVKNPYATSAFANSDAQYSNQSVSDFSNTDTTAVSGQSTASQHTVKAQKQLVQKNTQTQKQAQGGDSHGTGPQHHAQHYKMTTEVLSARQIVQESSGQSCTPLKVNQQASSTSSSRQNFHRMMHREKRNAKYVPKRNQPPQNHHLIDESPRQAYVRASQQQHQSLPYHPLRRHQNNHQYHAEYHDRQDYHHRMHYGYDDRYYDSPATHQRQAAQASCQKPPPKRKHVHHHDRAAGARCGQKTQNSAQKSDAKRQTAAAAHGFPLTGSLIAAAGAGEPHVRQVKIQNDGNPSYFANHPVHSLQGATNENRNSAKVTANKIAHGQMSQSVYTDDLQQLQRREDFQNLTKPQMQNKIQNIDIKAKDRQDINRVQQTNLGPQSNPHAIGQFNSLRQNQPMPPQQAHCLRFNAVQNNQVPQVKSQNFMNIQESKQESPNMQQRQQVQLPEGFTPMRVQNAHAMYPSGQQSPGAGYQMPYAANHNQVPLNWQQPSHQHVGRPPVVGPGFYPAPHQHHQQPWPQPQTQQPFNMQVVSTPLRMKTVAQQSPKKLEQQAQEGANLVAEPKTPTQKSKLPDSDSKHALQIARNSEKSIQNPKNIGAASPQKAQKKSQQQQQQQMSQAQNQASTESAEEESKDKDSHTPTFECLTKCTEWYLIAQVGNSQVKIPAKNMAVRFSDNPQELPILTKDMDLIENLVQKETQSSTSASQIVQLNRPVNAGYNPSSSNNQSNNGYRKKDHVLIAQRDYDKSLALNLVGDQESEQQSKFPLHLPISNNSMTAETRLIDLYMHHRTQQLMCLEFDVTHLKLDEVDSSFSGDYSSSDTFSINPLSQADCFGAGAAAVDPSQPTPFMGLPKTTGCQTAYGQPSCVLYINEGNSVAKQLRLINQDYVEGMTYFKLNGECHGKLVFEQDLKYSIQGKKVIKSIQERLIRAKEHIYNEVVRMDPNVALRHKSNSSGRNSSNGAKPEVTPASGTAASRSEQKMQVKPHKRSQKSILGLLRQRNKKNKGPYLRRSDQIHIPIVNVAKSLGFKMMMSNLASIDNMLTNFNQIVMQEGIIQSFFFSFDLPVHQLSTTTPTVSNSLVVKMPKDQTGGGPQAAYQQQAAYLAYQQHRAAMVPNFDPMMHLHQLQQQQQMFYAQPEMQPQQVQASAYGSQYNTQSPSKGRQAIPGHQDSTDGVPRAEQSSEQVAEQSANQDQQSQQPLWNLVDEFKRISQDPPPCGSSQQDQAWQGAEKQQMQPMKSQPFTYRVFLDHQQQASSGGQVNSSPFSQHFASSSANSNCSSNFQQPPFLSCLSSLVSQGDGNQPLQAYGGAGSGGIQLSDAAVSSQTSNLSTHQAVNYGPMFSHSPNQDNMSSNGVQSAGKGSATQGMGGQQRPLGQAPMLMHSPLAMQPQLPIMPQQLHQALYSISGNFNPGFSYGGGASSGPNSQAPLVQPEAPIYVPPEDPNYLSNLDRLLESITPRVCSLQLETSTVHEFFKAFKRSSVFGLRVELLNEQTLESEIFTFSPSLSSLVLSYTKPMLDSTGDRVNRILDFEITDPSKAAKADQSNEASKEVKTQEELVSTEMVGSKADSNAKMDIQHSMSKSHQKFIEIHESEPHYSRPAFFTKVKEIISDLPHLKQVLLKPGSFNFDSSWFSILWTCQRVCEVPTDLSQSTAAESHGDTGAEAGKMGCSSISSIQFLAIFRFRPDTCLRSIDARAQRRQPVELIGLMPYKYERESFWVSPSHLQTDNNLQGEMYDQICEDNIILLQDLKQRAIEFLQMQSQREYMHDFSYLLNSTNSSIFEIF